MFKRQNFLKFALPLIAATQLISAAPFGTDPSVLHSDGWDGSLPGVKSWLVGPTSTGSNSHFCFYGISNGPNGDIYISTEDHLTNSSLNRLDHKTDILWMERSILH